MLCRWSEQADPFPPPKLEPLEALSVILASQLSTPPSSPSSPPLPPSSRLQPTKQWTASNPSSPRTSNPSHPPSPPPFLPIHEQITLAAFFLLQHLLVSILRTTASVILSSSSISTSTSPLDKRLNRFIQGKILPFPYPSPLYHTLSTIFYVARFPVYPPEPQFTLRSFIFSRLIFVLLTRTFTTWSINTLACLYDR